MNLIRTEPSLHLQLKSKIGVHIDNCCTLNVFRFLFLQEKTTMTLLDSHLQPSSQVCFYVELCFDKYLPDIYRMSCTIASLTSENVFVIQPVQWLPFTRGHSSSKRTTRSWGLPLLICMETASSKAAVCYLTASARSLKLLFQKATAYRTRESA